jgi:Uma2 family endonuclease
MHTSQTSTPPTIYYPESDGTPVGESDSHRDLMFELIFAIQNLLRGTAAYVAGNLFIYYKEGDPKTVICPDLFVAFGVPQRRRRVYKSWEHGGKLPDLVIELSSNDTRVNDLGPKRVLYAELGVQEYFLFDPLGDYLRPPLRGYELVDGELVPMPGPRCFSKLLGVELKLLDGWLRLADPASGALLATPQEAHETARRGAEARRLLEAENARLRAELARLRGEEAGGSEAASAEGRQA